MLAELRRLADLGYTISLDDFVMRPDSLALLEVAHYVKIDVQAFTRDQLADQVAQLETHKVKLIASKIEDHHTFEFCKDAGFDYFQGYFFCQPKTVAGRGIPDQPADADAADGRAAGPRLRAGGPRAGDQQRPRRQLPAAALDQLGLLLAAAQGQLRARGADAAGRPRNVRSWALLMTLAGIDDQPSELIRTAMMRAKMCELIAQALGRPDPDAYFTVGLFSVRRRAS